MRLFKKTYDPNACTCPDGGDFWGLTAMKHHDPDCPRVVTAARRVEFLTQPDTEQSHGTLTLGNYING